MPRNDASRLYLAAQVQGRTLERQADGLRQRLCRLAEGQGGLQEALRAIEAMRVQLVQAEALARELIKLDPSQEVPSAWARRVSQSASLT